MSSDAARFRDKRTSEELVVGVSESFFGRLCFNELRRLESVEMLNGDRGVSENDWPTSTEAVAIIMIC